MFNWILRNVIGKIMARSVRRRLNAFLEATQNPEFHQDNLLRKILATHADTAFGVDHRFRDIRSMADYRRNIPVAPYEYIEPYVTRMRRGELNALLADKKIHMFALTSGTTATRKYIPVNSQYLADYRRGWNIWGLKVYRDHPAVRFRPMVQMSGDWQEFTTDTGIPCGTVTGLTATMQRRVIRYLYCVPPCVGRVKNAEAKYYLALRLSVPRRPGMILAANPSTLVNLVRTGDREKETLIRDIHNGTLDDRFDIPEDIRAAVHRKIRKKDPKRAKELEAVVRATDTLYPKDYWSHEYVIGNWTGGSVGAYMRDYPKYFGDAPVRDVGLIASEGRMTIPMEDGTSSGALDVTSHVFEFIPEGEIDSVNPTVLSAHELEEGENYYILMTTGYGLYRYHIHDVVRVTGFLNKTPMIEFLGKGAHFANITGEKLSEYHVSGAMTDVLHDLDLSLNGYVLAACWDDVQPFYGLFVERDDVEDLSEGMLLANQLEHRLCRVNFEYAAKRESERLGPVRLNFIPANTWREWDRQRLMKTGGALEQYKRPCLISDFNFRETIPVEEGVPVGDL